MRFGHQYKLPARPSASGHYYARRGAGAGIDSGNWSLHSSKICIACREFCAVLLMDEVTLARIPVTGPQP
jgi:hypothetical protein